MQLQPEILDCWPDVRRKSAYMVRRGYNIETQLSSPTHALTGKDKGGRTLLHKAVLWEQENIVEFVLQQLPQIVNLTDNLNRSGIMNEFMLSSRINKFDYNLALHYCACLPLPNRKKLWQMLASKTSGCNPTIRDVNDMTAADYVKEMERETPVESKRLD